MISIILSFLIKAVILYIFFTKVTIDTANWWDLTIVIGIFVVVDFLLNLIPNSGKTNTMRKLHGLDNINFAMTVYYAILGLVVFYFFDAYRALGKMNHGMAAQILILAVILFLYNFLFKLVLRIGSKSLAEGFAVNTSF